MYNPMASKTAPKSKLAAVACLPRLQSQISYLADWTFTIRCHFRFKIYTSKLLIFS